MAEYHGIWRNITEYGGISGNMAEYHGIWWKITEYMSEYHGIWRNITEYHDIFPECTRTSRYFPMVASHAIVYKHGRLTTYFITKVIDGFFPF
jgi:hypothetical protein